MVFRFRLSEHIGGPCIGNLMVLAKLSPCLLDGGWGIVTPYEIHAESRRAKMMELCDFAAERERLCVDDDGLAVVVEGKEIVVVISVQFEIFEIADAFARAESVDGGVDADVRNGERRVLIDDDV